MRGLSGLPGPGERGATPGVQWRRNHAPIPDETAVGRASGDDAAGHTRQRTRPLPPGYALDISDPDVLFLLRPGGEAVAVFSAVGATEEGVLEAAERDVQIGRASNTDKPCQEARG